MRSSLNGCDIGRLFIRFSVTKRLCDFDLMAEGTPEGTRLELGLNMFRICCS